MANTRISSVLDPLDDARALRAAIDVVKLAQGMGLMPAGARLDRLDLGVIRQVAESAAGAGIGFAAVFVLTGRKAPSPQELAQALDELREALMGSPAPATEWPALIDLLGPDRLAALVGAAASSVRRYAAGARATPDDVAARLHVLAIVAGELLGAYTSFGIRRWLERPRTPLQGRSPKEVLSGDWDPDGPEVQQVLTLARSLGASAAT